MAAFAALVRGRERFEMTGLPSQDQDIKEGVTGTDAGFVIGGGFSVGRIGIEGRFDAALRNLIPPRDRRPGEPEPKNQSLAVLARLRL
jgi:hypothetical protein